MMNKQFKPKPWDEVEAAVKNTKTFKEVSKVLGKDEAIEQLRIAYEGYNWDEDEVFYEDFIVEDEGHMCSFLWRATPQGHDFWKCVSKGQVPPV